MSDLVIVPDRVNLSAGVRVPDRFKVFFLCLTLRVTFRVCLGVAVAEVFVEPCSEFECFLFSEPNVKLETDEFRLWFRL